MLLNEVYGRIGAPARSMETAAQVYGEDDWLSRQFVLEGRQLHQCLQNTVPRRAVLQL